MNAEETMAGWARRAVEDGAWLLHVPTLVVGQATGSYDGRERVYVSPVNGEPVTGPVVVLHSGHALVANPNAFMELTSKEVAFYSMVHEMFAAFLKRAVTEAASAGVPAERTIRLMLGMLQAQARALESFGKGERA